MTETQQGTGIWISSLSVSVGLAHSIVAHVHPPQGGFRVGVFRFSEGIAFLYKQIAMGDRYWSPARTPHAICDEDRFGPLTLINPNQP